MGSLLACEAVDTPQQPSIERRIKAAITLAGLDFQQLADRINSNGYGERTLRRIADEHDPDRRPRASDLHVIAKACGVSDAFWTIDFSALAEPDLREEISELRDELEALALVVAQQAQQLRELHDRDRWRPPLANGPR